MKFLSWNIQQGGGTRIARIVEAIKAHDPDVIALSEYRTPPGVILCSNLKAAGWPYLESSFPVGKDNGLCVFSRTPLIRTRQCPAPPENLHRWLDIDLPAHGFGFAALHIICSGTSSNVGVPGESKRRFWKALLGAAETRLHEPFLFLGDFNTGAHGLDEAGKTFACTEHFTELSALGYIDMWRDHNGGPTEWTWYSKLKGGVRGNGFRIDHAFATPSLRPRITSCRYSHVEREEKISDHSIMIVEVE